MLKLNDKMLVLMSEFYTNAALRIYCRAASDEVRVFKIVVLSRDYSPKFCIKRRVL